MKDLKTSVIVEITPKTDKIDTFTLENGDKGDVWKNSNSYAVGEQIKYEIVPNQKSEHFLPNFKIERPNVFKSKAIQKDERAENKRFALQMAVNLKIAGLTGDVKTLETAKKFFNFLEEK